MRDATHVTPPIAASRIANESASSDAGRLPAAHRTGMATGELNGMSESVTARVELGSFSIANMLMNDSTSIHATGCCAWRASCSVDDMAPTAANMAEYRKKPPRKYAMKTANVAPVTCGT